MSDKDVAIKGGFWTGLSTAVTLFVTFARVMILTRFLDKSDFGVVSIVNMVIGLCTTFTDLGFASVIMYRQKMSEKEFSTLFWLQLIVFVIIYAILCALSPIVSSFYSEPSLAALIPLASLSIIFQALGNLYDSVLQKRYLFKMIAFRNVLSNVISLVISVWMAWKGFGVYSLIFSTLSQVIIINAWNFTTGLRVYPIRFSFGIKEVLPLLKIGIYQTGTRILDFVSNKIDVMIIGKLLGMEVLGVYDLAKDLVYRLVDYFRSVVSKVALPIISNNNSDDDAVRSRFLIATRVVSMICFPICFTLAVFSRYVVNIVYGAKYLVAAPIVSIYAVITVVTSVSCFFDMLGVAKGKTNLNFLNTVFRVLLTTPMVFFACHISITAVSVGQLIVTLITWAIYWNVVVQRTYPMSLSIYLSQFGRLFIVLFGIGLLFYVLISVHLLAFIDNWVIEFVIYALVYSMLLVASAKLFLKEDISFIVKMLPIEKWKRKF